MIRKAYRKLGKIGWGQFLFVAAAALIVGVIIGLSWKLIQIHTCGVEVRENGITSVVHAAK